MNENQATAIINSFFQSLFMPSNSINNNESVMLRLSNSLKKLANVFEEIADILNFQGTKSSPVPAYQSSASTANQYKKQPIFVPNFPHPPKKTDYPKNASPNQSAHGNNFMDTLVKLKNDRNDSFYKMSRNKLLVAITEKNLTFDPIRIPKKFAPKITRTDHPDIAKQKIDFAIQSTRSEIEKLNLHYNIHEQKIQKIDKDIEKHIQTETNENKKINYLNTCKKIINESSSKTISKLSKKETFFNSDKFMVNIDYRKYINSENSKAAKENNEALVSYTQTNETIYDQTHILSESFLNNALNEPFETSQASQLKRTASQCSLSSSNSQQITKRKQQDFSTSTQQSQPNFMQPTISSLSKNDKATSTAAKMKLSTQP